MSMEAAERDHAPLSRRLSEAESIVYGLRLDLAEATALIEALESELSNLTSQWRGPDDGRLRTGTLNAIVHARTLVRRILFQELAADRGQASTMQDLRIAEASFGFLLRLRTLRTHAGHG